MGERTYPHAYKEVYMKEDIKVSTIVPMCGYDKGTNSHTFYTHWPVTVLEISDGRYATEVMPMANDMTSEYGDVLYISDSYENLDDAMSEYTKLLTRAVDGIIEKYV